MPPTVFIKDRSTVTSPGRAADSSGVRLLTPTGWLDGPGLLPLLALSLLGAVGFAVLGLLALRLTIEPGINACPVWPAAGWSVLLILRFGWRALPGALVGSLATEFTQGHLNGAVLTAPAFIAVSLGATLANALRLLTGWLLIRRWARSAPDDPAGPALLPALLCAMVAGMLGGAVGATVLTLAGSPVSGWLDIAWTWASGDAIGTLVMWPLLVPLLWTDRWRMRRALLLVLPILLAFLGVVGFYAVARDSAAAAQREQVQQEAQALAELLQRRIQLDCEALVALEAFFLGSQAVDAEEYRIFCTHVLSGRRTIQGLNWVQRVPGAERDAFIAARRAEGEADFSIRRQLADGSRAPALVADEHRVATYVAPLDRNAGIVGMDLLQVPFSTRYYDEAERRAAPHTSPPIRLLQETGQQQGCVVTRPVWLSGSDRTGRVHGWAVIALRLEDLVAGALPDFDEQRFSLVLRDADTGVDLVQRSRDGVVYLAELAQDLPIAMPGRSWGLHLTPSPAVAGESQHRAWWSLLAGSVVVGVLGLLLLSTLERNDLIARRVAAKTVELARANADLERTRDLADQANRAKSEFLATMSHEIRTPLNGVIGTVDLLTGTNLDARQREWLSTIKNCGEGLLRLINDILDLSKIEAGQLRLEETPFVLPELAHEAAALFAGKAQSRAVGITCRIDEDLPRRVSGDPARLRQVLMNLIGNAVKFTERGAVLLLVEAGGVDSEDRLLVRFTVSDTGIGIAPEAIERLFKPFAQANSSMNRRYGGTGLGLAICRRLVDAMGGQILVTSEPGQGSVFTFTIPLPRNDRTEVVRDPSTRLFGPISGKRVLLVEDNPVNQRVASAMLEKLGCNCVLAEDGQQALQRLRQEAFDVVLMDCQMPEMDGYEATRQHRAEEGSVPGRRRLPIIALTANAFQADRRKCLEAGMDDFLAKPVTLEALRRKLGEWVGGRAPPPSADDTAALLVQG